MKRIAAIIAMSCLFALFFGKEVGESLIRAVLFWKTGAHFSCGDLRWSNGSFIADRIIVFDSSSPNCRFRIDAESARLSFPLCLSLEKPHVSLRRDALGMLFSNSNFLGKIEMNGGELFWLDGSFPSMLFSLGKDQETLWLTMEKEEVCFAFKQDANGIESRWSKLPLAWLLPGQSGGIVSGQIQIDGNLAWANEVQLQINGENVFWNHREDRYAGSSSIDWKAREIPLNQALDFHALAFATERIRASISNGSMGNGRGSLKSIDGLLTYRSGVGGKVDGRAVAEIGAVRLPVHCDAKASLHPARSAWSIGECALGSGWIWSEIDSGWNVHWAHLGVDEIAFLKSWISGLEQWNWVSGQTGGKIVQRGDSYELESLEVEMLQLESTVAPIRLGCEALSYHRVLTIAKGWADVFGRAARDWRGSWDRDAREASFLGEVDGVSGEISIQDCGGQLNSRIRFGDAAAIEGVLHPFEMTFDIAGVFHGLCFNGTGAYDPSLHINLEIPEFSGDVEMRYFNAASKIQGMAKVRAIDEGFSLEGRWENGWRTENWSLALLAESGACSIAPQISLDQLRFCLRADPDSIDVSRIRGISRFAAADRTLDLPFESPRVKIGSDQVFFDLRFQRKTWDILRVVGESRDQNISFDASHCHLLGWPLSLGYWTFDEKGILTASLKTSLSLPLVQSLLGPLAWVEPGALEGDLDIQALYDRGAGLSMRIEGIETHYDNRPFPFSFSIEQKEAALAIGALSAMGSYALDGDSIRIANGKGAQSGISFDFEGKIDASLQADFTILALQADAKALANDFVPAGVDGSLTGKGCCFLGTKGFEADLEIAAKNIAFQGYKLENHGPVHLYYSSSQGALLKGLEGKVEKGGLELVGKVGLCQIDPKRRRWMMDNAQFHVPAALLAQTSQQIGGVFDEGHDLDLTAEIDSAFDCSNFSCEIREGSFPIGGSLRHIRDLHLDYTPDQIFGDCIVEYRGNEAKVLVDVEIESPLVGRVILDDANEAALNPLAIDWTYGGDGLCIQSIDGSFGGMEALFHAQNFDGDSRLIGSARVDFSTLSHWIHPDVAQVFEEIGMGKGYELKGHLMIGQKTPSDIRFSGILSGKQMELFGYELRTLLGRVSLSPTQIDISDLKISDQAGIMKIDLISIGSKNQEPWTLDIPKLVIEDLRPSLLHKPNEEAGTLLPLLVRKLTMTDFHGLLDEGKTYKAKGELTFVNSFKRGETVFDVPANLFGRIIGLDVDLLIPVKGDLSFLLQDGYFMLTDLRDAFSEGGRSEFFLVTTEDSPRMDLDGNLQILIQMKQFVLFKITEAFWISVEGKLNNPQFSLQKKRRFSL